MLEDIKSLLQSSLLYLHFAQRRNKSGNWELQSDLVMAEGAIRNAIEQIERTYEGGKHGSRPEL